MDLHKEATMFFSNGKAERIQNFINMVGHTKAELIGRKKIDEIMLIDKEHQSVQYLTAKSAIYDEYLTMNKYIADFHAYMEKKMAEKEKSNEPTEPDNDELTPETLEVAKVEYEPPSPMELMSMKKKHDAFNERFIVVDEKKFKKSKVWVKIRASKVPVAFKGNPVELLEYTVNVITI